MSSHADLIPALAALAIEAGREIMAVYQTDFSAERKDDGSPVTIADQRAEAVILAGLSRLMPGAPVIAEEEVAAGRVPAIKDCFFLVDPLDGTKDFLQRRAGEFTVNIGLIENGFPVAGAVYAPAVGDLYAGAVDTAYRQRFEPLTFAPLGDPVAIRVAARGPADLRPVTSRTDSSPRLDAFLTAIGGEERRKVSSSIKFCLLAAGELDLYPRFGQVNEWDAAAGDAVLRAAGGGVITLDGAPLLYGTKAPDFLVNGFIAYGGAAARQAARAALAQ
jgi:3'(2'), 5'-bisphosphate nucleotidase